MVEVRVSSSISAASPATATESGLLAKIDGALEEAQALVFRTLR